MAVSSTSFSERLERIQARAEAGEAGFVTPGVVDQATADQAVGKAPKARRGYLGTALSGAFMSLCVMALGVTFVVSDVETGSLEELASTLLTKDE